MYATTGLNELIPNQIYSEGISYTAHYAMRVDGVWFTRMGGRGTTTKWRKISYVPKFETMCLSVTARLPKD